MEPLLKILCGAICFLFGLALFIYISNDTKKKNRDINIYEFNVYGASFLLFLVGLYMFCMGIIEI